MNNSGIAVRAVSKSFTDFQLGPITLQLMPGRAYGLLGPNGAGKTTLLNLLSSQMRASSGDISFDGNVLRWADPQWRRHCTYVRESPVFYDDLTIQQTTQLVECIYGYANPQVLDEWSQRLQLQPRKRVGQLSKGSKVKLSLLLALAHDSPVLLLDEPSAGLDPTARRDLQLVLIDLMQRRPSTLLVLSSHLFDDIDAVCTDVVIIRQGHIAFTSPCDGIVAYRQDLGQQCPVCGIDATIWDDGRYRWIIPRNATATAAVAAQGMAPADRRAVIESLYHHSV